MLSILVLTQEHVKKKFLEKPYCQNRKDMSQDHPEITNVLVAVTTEAETIVDVTIENPENLEKKNNFFLYL
jgi:hypothetical protein